MALLGNAANGGVPKRRTIRARAYAQAVPVWSSVLIAVVAAAASGFFGAWLVAWNDRHERFRDRMINAADDLAGAGAQALIAVRDAIYSARQRLAPSAQERIGLAWKKRDAVLSRRARVDLLFGPDSETARAADDLIRELGTATDKVQGEAPNLDAADAAYEAAQAKLQDFERAALNGIRLATPPSATIRESFRRLRQGSP